MIITVIVTAMSIKNSSIPQGKPGIIHVNPFLSMGNRSWIKRHTITRRRDLSLNFALSAHERMNALT